MGSKELLSEQVFHVLPKTCSIWFSCTKPLFSLSKLSTGPGHKDTLLLLNKLFFFFQIHQSETVCPPLPVRSVACVSLYLCSFLLISFRIFPTCPCIACCPLASWEIGSISKFFKTWGASLNYFVLARSYHKAIFTNFAESITPP